MRDFVNGWTNGPDWKTWVAHSTIASGLTLLLWWPVGLHSAAEVAVGYYLIRECEQVLYDFVDRKSVRAKLVDHVMDVVSPAAVVACLVLTMHLAFRVV